MSNSIQESITTAIRLLAFGVTLVPLGALFLPWITLDGTDEVYSGVTSIALLASPIRDYLFGFDPIQASLITIGPAVMTLLTIIISQHYYGRKSIPWVPPIMLAIVVGITYFATDLTSAIHMGLDLVAIAAVLLILHQVAIRIQVAIRRRSPYSRATGILAIATGIAYRPRRRRRR